MNQKIDGVNLVADMVISCDWSKKGDINGIYTAESGLWRSPEEVNRENRLKEYSKQYLAELNFARFSPTK